MALELNSILENNTGQTALPAHIGENAFFHKVVTPLYDIVKKEEKCSDDGKAPHSSWRNYDDINEYFWSSRCFEELGWPLKMGSNFFQSAKWAQSYKDWDTQRIRRILHKQQVGKMGFLEQRSFWNIFHSFDRLWIMYILFLHAAISVASQGSGTPWIELRHRDTQA